MNETDFNAAARALQRANGLSEETALDYMARIGDTPEVAADGRVIVRADDGSELARVILPGSGTELPLKQRVRALMHANQINEYTALRYAGRIEGKHEVDAAGKVIVRDELGRELARVIFPKNVAEISEDAFEEPRRGKGSRRSMLDARIVIREGQTIPVVTHGGRIFAIETKPSLLDIGIAAMQPLKADLDEDYDAPVEFRAFLPADPENGRMEDSSMQHFTTHPNIVALARRYYVLAVLGDAAEGPITITSEDIE